MKSLVTKADKREWLKQGKAPVRIELWPETKYVFDYGGPMKAWQLGVTERRENAVSAGKPEVVERGPVRATIRTRHKWGKSSFITDVSLYTGRPWVELRMEIDWHEKEVLTRLGSN